MVEKDRINVTGILEKLFDFISLKINRTLIILQE
jgi:hypothetical protein